jgi:hypothetical protein
MAVITRIELGPRICSDGKPSMRESVRRSFGRLRAVARAWRRLIAREPPRTTAERRLAAMLYGKFEAARLDDLFER